MMSNVARRKKMANDAQPGASLMFLQHFDVCCDITVLLRPSGPHQCNADPRMEVRPYNHPK